MRNSKNALWILTLILQSFVVSCAKSKSNTASISVGDADSFVSNGPADVIVSAHNVPYGIKIEEYEEMQELNTGKTSHSGLRLDAPDAVLESSYNGGGGTLETYTDRSGGAVIPTYSDTSNGKVLSTFDDKSSKNGLEKQQALNKKHRLEIVVKTLIPLPSKTAELGVLSFNLTLFQANGSSSPAVSQTIVIDTQRKTVSPVMLKGHFKEQHLQDKEQLSFIIDNVYADLMGRQTNRQPLTNGKYTYSYTIVDPKSGTAQSKTYSGQGKFTIEPTINVADQAYEADPEHLRLVDVRPSGWWINGAFESKPGDNEKFDQYEQQRNWSGSEHAVIQEGSAEDLDK